MIGTSGCRFVYVCRNPNDDVVSLRHFLNKLSLRITPSPSLKETFEKFSRREFYVLPSFLGPCVRLMESKLRVATENIVSQV
jgi:hypothetical protein